MYHKVKNTLAGLGMAALFVAGGLFFSEPVPARPEGGQVAPALQAEAAEKALAVVLVRTGSQLRLQSGMPYYSFGALIPRRQES